MYQYVLVQEICFGLGAGPLSVPGVAICATYFELRRALAVGIAASGSSAGGVIPRHTGGHRGDSLTRLVISGS